MGDSLIFAWYPKDRNHRYEPAYVFLAHQDVVPVDERDLAQWKYPPFSGTIAEGSVWGRGAIDDKYSVMALLEAAESLSAAGFRPERPIYLVFGQDEETGGHQGASKVAALFLSRRIGIKALFDEGSPIIEKPIPMLDRPLALIGIAEKGYGSFRFHSHLIGGHSSAPSRETSITILIAALAKIASNPPPSTTSDIVLDLFQTLGENSKGLKALMLQWIHSTRFFVSPLVLEKTASTNAMVSNTCVTTMMHAGVKDNVIPNEATAVVNCRVLPGTTLENVRKHFISIVNDDRIAIELIDGYNDAVTTASYDKSVYLEIEKTLHKNFGADVLVVPTLFPGSSDSKNFIALTKEIYRFGAYRIDHEQLGLFHGNNERISIDNYSRTIDLFRDLMVTLGTMSH